MTAAATAAGTRVCGWSVHGRLLRFEPPPDGPPLLAERVTVDEALGSGFEIHLEALAEPDADVDGLLGAEAGVHLEPPGGPARAWYGLVVESTRAGAAAGGVRWQLRLRPWTALLEQRHGCTLHEDLSTDRILEQVFSSVPGAAWRIVRGGAPVRRALCTQYAETDWAFCTRLMAEDGLGWRFEIRGGAEAASGRWRHVLVVDDGHEPPADLGRVRFAAPAPSVPAPHDTVSRFACHHAAGPAAVSVGAWSSCTAAFVAGGRASAPGVATGPLYRDVGGVDRFADAAEADACAERQLAAFELDRQLAQGSGTVPAFAPGAAFTLVDAPGAGLAGSRWVLTRVHHEAANALGPVLARRLGTADLDAGGYRNRFDAVPAARPRVPRLPPRALAPGLQTATVVGIEHGLPMADGALRVKLRYGWQGDADPGEDGVGQAVWPLRRATGRRGSAWVRVVQPMAGPGWGAVFVPRVGAEVLVGHLDGDIDRPVVLGALFNGRDRPPYAGTALSGVLSAMPGRGAACGEWVLDDSCGQLRTRLASLPAAAELGLGHLVVQPPGSARRGEVRGRGFEAATAGRASLRAGRGLLVSTHRRDGRGGSCDGAQMDVQEPCARLDRAAGQAASRARAAAARGGTAPPSAQAPAALAAAGLFVPLGDLPAGPVQADAAEHARLVVAAEATLVLASAAELLQAAGRDLVSVAGAGCRTGVNADAALAAGGRLQLSAGGDLRCVAAAGDAAVRAHAGALSLQAEGRLRLQAADGELRLVARRRLVLRAGGSALVLDGADVRFTTAGSFVVESGAQRFPGPGRVDAPLPALPLGRPGAPPNWIAIAHHDADGRPFAGQRYTIRFDGGATIEGRLDAEGEARHEDVPERVLQVEYEPRDALPAAPWPPLAELVAALQQRLA
ncbi:MULTISPECIES: type VI secretion system tip protein TssI/VgrG [unclassified Rubrivivax]|uniref:type VI secretion system tip protein TssI/VgrG n=1 Tax=unclassified Rubrivivax TaxID=2649762 RepID=UPI001E6533CD|nr:MULTISPECIES: type VI secretion system tip protein TssI/VgrG [unclassified Rubrivivax]MCC9597796.1 type VI secretion system tip protein VgrG [Rubrivivax sp. JA1055]MCC9645947.1 type VI secretion system tip protein VgrG [Rubrivivax sp. JA1029]